MSDEKQEPTSSIGQTLHDARVKKGLTIDDLQKNTKIQKRYLIAIDENKFDELPGDFYVRAFVKQYADAVGLDGTELLKSFDETLPDTKNPEYVDRVSEDKIATRTAQQKVDDRNLTIRRYVPVTVISVAVLLVILVIWFAAAKSSNNSQQTNIGSSSSSVSVSGSSSSSSAESSSTKAKPKATKKAKQTTKSTTVKETTTSTNGGTYAVKTTASTSDIKITTSAKAWVGVNVNGSSVYQASQDANANHTVKLAKGTTAATINLGNATSTKLFVNGQEVKLSGSSQVQNVTLNFSK